jgi:uncharacterized protein (TIGR03437 family)
MASANRSKSCRAGLSLLRLARIAALTVGFAIAAFGQCGVERWPVKTGTDPDANKVDLNHVAPTTIASLAALAAPANLPQNNRVQPIETTEYVLSARLVQYKLEADSDYHIVLSDDAGRTMIIEIPHPKCVGSSSPFAAPIANARAEFDARFVAIPSFKSADVPVQVRGIAFFDSLHGQTGVAPNGIELHPVLDIVFGPTITSVGTAGGFPDLAPNTWIEIKGTDLAPPGVGAGGMTWSNAPEFDSGRLPAQLAGVSVTVNGTAAYVYFVSATQINVLTPLNLAPGPVKIVVTTGTLSSAPATKTARAVAPSFLLFGASKYIAATHADGSLLGPASMSAPGYPFTPAAPGETIALYATGFGLPAATLTEGSATQFGLLPSMPTVQIGGASVDVRFAGVVSPGLYQLNVVVPTTAVAGDAPVTATYAGLTTPLGSLIPVQQRP